MNIVLLHYAAPPVVGGVETVLARQALLLANAGHRVRIITGRGETWDARIPVDVQPKLDSRHPQVLKMKADLDEGRVPSEFESLVDQIRADLTRAFEGVDAVIVHNVASLHKNLAFTAALHLLSQEKSSPRFILWHHDLAWTAPRYQSEIHPGYPWNLLCTAWPGARQVTISAARRQELADLMNIPLWEIVVVPAGLDMAEFLDLGKKAMRLVDKLDLFRAAPILLTPVRITRRKNLEMGIHILAQLKKQMPDAALIITGPPGAHNPTNQQYLEQLQQQRDDLGLGGSVHLLGELVPDGLPEATVADFFRISDALLLTSREEGFGIPVLEAGLARLPIFCTNLPSLKALAIEWATYFSPVEDPGHVAAIIHQRLKNDPLYQMRVRVRRQYTWMAVYQNKILPLLQDTTSSAEET
jgi:glycosyltransferase involved in cell wall biosynthesis